MTTGKTGGRGRVRAAHRRSSPIRSHAPDRPHDDSIAELFAADPSFAAEYLNNILEEGDQAELLIALRQMAQASGGVAVIAHRAHVNPTQLYRTLSRHGNPELRGFSAILRALGMRLRVSPLDQETRR